MSECSDTKPIDPNHFSAEHRRQFLAAMMAELHHAYSKHGARPWSRHEFYAVMKEEVDEVWDAIKSDAPMRDVLKEVMQVAAVCLRFSETPEAYQGEHQLPLPSRDATDKVERPRRAYTLEIEISGDTWEAVLADLEHLSYHIADHGPECKSVMGGVDSSHIVTITHRPEMTHELYMDCLTKYLERQP